MSSDFDAFWQHISQPGMRPVGADDRWIGSVCYRAGAAATEEKLDPTIDTLRTLLREARERLEWWPAEPKPYEVRVCIERIDEVLK